jgi:hypothetical protein
MLFSRQSIGVVVGIVLFAIFALLIISRPEPVLIPERESMVSPTPANRDDEIRNLIVDAVIMEGTYQEWDDGMRAFTLTFVSTGEAGVMELKTEAGEIVLAHVVYGYGVNAARQLVTVPVALAAELPNGDLISFEEFTLGEGMTTDELAQLQAQLPRGKIITTMLFDAITNYKPDWELCRFEWLNHGEVCSLGQTLSERYPRIDPLLVSGTLQQKHIPAEGWALFGWMFHIHNELSSRSWHIELPGNVGGN